MEKLLYEIIISFTIQLYIIFYALSRVIISINHLFFAEFLRFAFRSFLDKNKVIFYPFSVYKSVDLC